MDKKKLYGATAADERLDEHLVGQDVQLLLLLPLRTPRQGIVISRLRRKIAGDLDDRGEPAH